MPQVQATPSETTNMTAAPTTVPAPPALGTVMSLRYGVALHQLSTGLARAEMAYFFRGPPEVPGARKCRICEYVAINGLCYVMFEKAYPR